MQDIKMLHVKGGSLTIPMLREYLNRFPDDWDEDMGEIWIEDQETGLSNWINTVTPLNKRDGVCDLLFSKEELVAEYAYVDTKNYVGNWIMNEQDGYDEDPFIPVTIMPSKEKIKLVKALLGWDWDEVLG